MITFEEFKQRIDNEFRELNKNAPVGEIDHFLKEKYNWIKESYEHKKRNYNGADEYVTSGIVYALNLEF